jgi:hypothetical protein
MAVKVKMDSPEIACEDETWGDVAYGRMH